MPKVKIDHIVTYSSEDPKHPANNLLLNDPAKKWKCQTAGEKSANVVLQLEKATLISGIDIGNEHSAYVEVLVTRSSRNDDFKPLLVMSSFMTPFEARQSQNMNKVRMFTLDQLSKPECTEKWDRIKIVCTQPFNRHVQYGLSFIVIHSNDKDLLPSTPTSTIQLNLRPESPNPFTPGKLFAERKEKIETPSKGTTSIREATTPAYLAKHGPPICKPKKFDPKPTTSASNNNKTDSDEKILSRNRDSLLYDKEDEEPNEKIDNIVKKDQKQKELIKEASKKELTATPKRTLNKDISQKTPSSLKNESVKRKADNNNTPNKKPKKSDIKKPFNSLLEGVVLTISGILNPDRGNLRKLALEMGAKYKPDWDQSCTHLICAFINTPKFNQVKGKGKIVTRKWIEDCHKERKRFPWRRYALDRNDQKKDESEDEISEEVTESVDDDADLDTDEEIERIRQQQNQQQSPDDTDEEVLKADSPAPLNKNLKDIFQGKTFFIDSNFSQDIYRTIRKYIIAYAGEITEDPTDNIHVFITVKDNCEVLKEINSNGAFLDPSWIWDCHNEQKLIPINNYVL